MLVEDAVSHIFLNPHIWCCTVFKVQRELYIFLMQKLDNDPRLLENFCRLPRVLDIIRLFYCDNCKCRYMTGGKSVLHPMESQAIGERLSKEEVQTIRILLLSLGEMNLRCVVLYMLQLRSYISRFCLVFLTFKLLICISC